MKNQTHRHLPPDLPTPLPVVSVRVCPRPLIAGAQASDRRRGHAEAAPDPSADPLAELFQPAAPHQLSPSAAPRKSAIPFNPQGE